MGRYQLFLYLNIEWFNWSDKTRQDDRVDVSPHGGDPKAPLSLATTAKVGEGATPFPSVCDHFVCPTRTQNFSRGPMYPFILSGCESARNVRRNRVQDGGPTLEPFAKLSYQKRYYKCLPRHPVTWSLVRQSLKRQQMLKTHTFFVKKCCFAHHLPKLLPFFRKKSKKVTRVMVHAPIPG